MRNKIIGIFIILYTVVIFGVAYWYVNSRPVNVTLEDYGGVDIYKTVAHLPIDCEELELLYTDSVHDIAYYRYVGDRTQLVVGDEVKLSTGDACTVRNIDMTGFYLDNADRAFVGLSGTIVTNSKGETVGYVSSIKNQMIYCIWS